MRYPIATALAVCWGAVLAAAPGGGTETLDIGIAKDGAPNATIVVDPSGRGDVSTIQEAADRARSGDTVLVRPGIYREEVRVRRGGYGPEGRVTFRSEVLHGAIIRGSEVWTNSWRRLGSRGKVVASKIDLSQFSKGRLNPYVTSISIGAKDTSHLARPLTNEVLNADTFAERTLGQVFLDGEELTEVTCVSSLRRTTGTWMVSFDGAEVWMNPTPSPLPLGRRLVEWSVRNRCFGAARRGLGQVVLDGFVIEHCANQGPFPQIGMVDVRTGGSWTIENNVIRHAKTVGLMLGAETWDGRQIPDVPEEDRRLMFGGNHTVRNNVVSDCGVAGISGWGAHRIAVYNNTVERNNRNGYKWPKKYWEEVAGIKFHGFSGTIANNLIRDNEANGVWLDTGFDNARVTGNVIVNNSYSGVMLESCEGHCLIDNNVFAFQRGWSQFYAGDGVYSHNGADVTVAHNLFLQNAGAGVRFRTLWGKTGNNPRSTSNNRYLNNVFIRNAGGDLCIAPESDVCTNVVSSGNVYLGGNYPGGAIDYLPFRFSNYNIGREKWDELHSRFESITTNGMSFVKWRALSQPMSLGEWQRLRKLDLDSAVAGGSGVEAQFSSRDLLLSLVVPSEIARMRVRSCNFSDFDFFGHRYPAPGEKVLPGPFQDAKLLSDKGAQFAVRPYDREGVRPPYRDWVRDDAPPSRAFRDHETVVFLGDSITCGGRWIGFVERYYLENFPSNTYRFVNAGIAGDRSDACLVRFEEDVVRPNPDVVVVMFGMNDLGGGPWPETRGAADERRTEEALQAYDRNLRTLAARIARDCPQARIVWCTPSIYDDGVRSKTPCDFNRNGIALARGAEVVRRLAAERGEQLVDIHGPMTDFSVRRQKADPVFSLLGPDRVHPQDPGAFFIACEFLRQQGLDPKAADPTVPWPATPVSERLARRAKQDARMAVLRSVRWYLRRQKEISDVDDMEQVRSFAAKLKAEGRKGYFEDRVAEYMRDWPWARRAIILEDIRRSNVEIADIARKCAHSYGECACPVAR